MNSYAPDNINNMDAGDYFYVLGGLNNIGESYVMTDPIGPVIIGFDPITFTQFSATAIYTAGNGLSLLGTQFNVDVDPVTLEINGLNQVAIRAGANLTTPNIGAATGISLSATGNINAGNIQTTGVISGTGNITIGNILTGGLISATGNLNAGNLITVGLISASGNITGNYIFGNIDAGGANTQVQFNDSGILNATAGFTFNKATNAVAVVGNVSANNVNTGNASVTGNIIIGKSMQLANNNGGTTQVFRMEYNAANAAVDFIFV
jgi:hypothetical protein